MYVHKYTYVTNSTSVYTYSALEWRSVVVVRYRETVSPESRLRYVPGLLIRPQSIPHGRTWPTLCYTHVKITVVGYTSLDVFSNVFFSVILLLYLLDTLFSGYLKCCFGRFYGCNDGIRVMILYLFRDYGNV